MTEGQTSSRTIGFWRPFRALVLTTLAVLIIATAVTVGVGRTLLPYADQLRPWLEERLSDAIGQDVRLDRVEAQWPRLTPSLTLIGLQLEDDSGSRLELDAARLEFHLPNLVDRRANLMRLVLLGLEVVLEPDEGGRWGAELAAGAAMTEGVSDPQLPGVDLLIRDAMVRVRPHAWPELALRLGEGGIERRGAQTLLYGGLDSDQSGSRLTELRLMLHHPDGRITAAEGWLGVEQLPLADWLPELDLPEPAASGSLDLQAWLEWAEAEDRLRLDLNFNLKNALSGDTILGEALVARSHRAIQLQLDHLSLNEQPVARGLGLGRDSSHWALVIDRLDLAGLHETLHPWLSRLETWPDVLDGRIEGLVLGMDRSFSVHAAAGRIDRFSIELNDPLPSVEGAGLHLALDGDRLVLAPDGQPTIRWPHLIRGDAVLDDIRGEVVLAPDAIELRELAIDSTVARASADGWIYLQQPRPFLDLFIDAERVGPIDPRPYLSYRTIPPPAMEWLDQAFTWVEAASGYVHLHMPAGTPAAELHPGSYQALIDFRGVDLDYWPEWPSGRSLDGRAEFVGKRLSGRLAEARVGEIELAVPELEIADLTAPDLRMSLEAEASDAGALAATLAAMPVAGWQAVLGAMTWSGPLDAKVSLDLPLRRMANWQMDGVAELDGARVALPAIGSRFEALTARVVFDQQQIQPTTIQARLAGRPWQLDLAAGFSEPAWLELSGPFNPAHLLPEGGTVGSLGALVSGHSHWHARLQGSGDDGLLLRLQSDLEGLHVDWPAPLAKPAEQAWPLHAEIITGDDRLDVSVTVEDRLAGRFASDAGTWQTALTFADSAPPLPPARGLTISGQVGALALDEWLTLFRPAADTAGAGHLPERLQLQLSADQLGLPGLTTDAAELRLDRSGPLLEARIDSSALAGSLTMPVASDSGRAVVIDIDHLHLPPAQTDTLVDTVPAQPLVTEISEQSPVGWPPLSIVIEDLRRGDLILGRLRFEAHASGSGLEIELFDVDGPDVRVQGRGRWVEPDSLPLSQFTGRISTSAMSDVLRLAGYEPGIEADRAQLDLDVQWPGSPRDFSLARLFGGLDVQIGEGRIPEARPGAGRLLGLISFAAIPRRLMLDFRDVFGPGMRFDEIEGRFDLAGGLARTDGVVMRAPAATITVSGDTDMVGRQYDQMLVVAPGLGATLPVLGVLAGGPVGAAAGLVLGQLLDRPLRGAAEVRYRITGAWESPRIELVDATVPDEEAQAESAGESPEADETDPID